MVGETYAAKLTAFDINEDASLSNRRVWADLTQSIDDGNVPVPDGMCLDAEEYLVASPSTADVIRVKEGGERRKNTKLRQMLMFLHARWKDRKTLFICTSNASELILTLHLEKNQEK